MAASKSGLLIRQSGRRDEHPILASATGGTRLTLGKRTRFIPARPFTPTRVSLRATGTGAAEITSDLSQALAFPGNVISVTARVRTLKTVYGLILGPQGGPLRNAHLRAGEIDFLSDDEGFFVTDIPEETRTIDHIRKGRVACHIKITPDTESEIPNLGTLACVPEGESNGTRPRPPF